jgi:hypothetical protein
VVFGSVTTTILSDGWGSPALKDIEPLVVPPRMDSRLATAFTD